MQNTSYFHRPLLGLAAAALCAASGLAQVTNDTCATAATVALGVNGPYNNTGATMSLAMSCGYLNGHDTWYQFTAPVTGSLTVDTCNSSGFDTVLQLYNGNSGCGSLTSLGCSDSGNCGGFTWYESTVSTSVTIGQLIYIQVAGYSGAQGSFYVNLAVTPSNNDCTTAIPVSVGANGPFGNAGANMSHLDYCGYGDDHDVWFTFTGTKNGLLKLDTCGGVFDSVVTVWDGGAGCGSLTYLNCADGGTCSGSFTWYPSSLVTPIAIGQVMYIQVAGYFGSVGTFTLNVAETPVNDDCYAAIPVAVGANGPYSNSGALTSDPAWPCGLGGRDVWFTWTAPSHGQLTADTCGGGYDTTIQLFEGNGGCGALNSLGCNDDSYCASVITLRSTLVATVNAGDVIYIRVGGFNGSQGTFPLNIAFQSGWYAQSTAYGSGCGKDYSVFYQSFPDMASFDLAYSGIRWSPNVGGGYTVSTAITPYVTPPGSATVLALTDENQVSVALSAPFSYDGGSTSTLYVGSNGVVSVAAGNTQYWNSTLTNFLNAPVTSWWCWKDLNAAASGSGQAKFHENSGIAYVTFDGVYTYTGTTAADANTFQFQFDTNTGIVRLVIQSMAASYWNYGTGIGAELVGYVSGGNTSDPGNCDLSARLPAGFQVAPAGTSVGGVNLSLSARPILGSSLSIDSTNLPPNTLACITTYGYGQFNPGVDLGPILQMPGCSLYNTLDANLAILPVAGNSSSFALTLPGNPAFIGLHVFLQSWTYTLGLNPSNLLTSNGVDILLGNF